jgi:hypothetical protein
MAYHYQRTIYQTYSDEKMIHYGISVRENNIIL